MASNNSYRTANPALAEEVIESITQSFLSDPPSMAFLFEIKNWELARLVFRLQREDIDALAADNPELEYALNLQLQELSIAETLIADESFAIRAVIQYEEEHRLAVSIAQNHLEAEAALLTCTGCESRFTRHQSYKAPCNHFYCMECLANFFEYTINDESLYPPKCCGQEIPFEGMKTLLDNKLITRYAKKQVEYDTEATKRTYCSVSTCKGFVPASNTINEVATCPTCGKRTCTICKAAAHRGDCPRDEDTQSLLSLAKTEGWQRCYNTKCHRVVALTTGCNHITCVCGAQFCYVCGARWRTCDCPRWNESWLVDGGDRPRHAGHRLFQPPQD
ncbi:hypothetical protein E4T42_08264 [Aureobasidium subglaciale]|nr:hypothetical protein E4T42_08264 [Aureobasidium subglaciale]